jgi:hypothetical protein
MVSKDSSVPTPPVLDTPPLQMNSGDNQYDGGDHTKGRKCVGYTLRIPDTDSSNTCFSDLDTNTFISRQIWVVLG